MAGYTRQSSFADGDTITAALFNDEYNQLVNAFNNATGHKHDGTAAEGPVIGLIGDAGETSPNNKVLIDSTNNYIEFYIEVSSAPVQQLYIADGAIVPVTDNDIDLGTSSLEFKNLYLDGTAKIDTLTVDEAATVGTTLGVTGATTLSSTLGVTGATTLSSTLAVTGATTLSSTLAVTGTSTLTGNVTTTNDLSVGGNLTVTGNAVISGNLTFGDADTDTITIGADVASNITPDVDDTYDLGTSTKEWRNLYIDGTANIDSLVADTADINAGTIDNTAIGGTTASSGAFTTLTASGATTLNGNVTLGDAATDNVVFNADVNSSIIPNTDNLYDLGSVSQEWRNLYIDGIANIDSLVADTADINGGTIDGVTIGGTTAGAVTFTDLSDGTITIAGFVDEDTMVSNSATLVPTQQSVKAYVDSQVTAQDLDFQGDTGGALSIDLDSETLTIAGGTGIDTSGSLNTLTVAIDSTVATLTGSQTLTNKTLTSPVINTGVSGTAVLDDDTFATASATTLATSESIKAYVDTRILTEDTLAEMNDVNITTPADGSLLFYDTTTSMWIDNVVSGDITIADTGVAAISSGVIVNDDINASAAISVSKTALVGGTGLTLTGDTLSVDASQTQITAVGTLTTGTWNATSIADAYIDNNLTISGGTVDNSVIGGSTPAAGTFTTLTANTSITGTLATAAQPNITSVGTLSSLTTSGNVTVGGNLTVNGTTTTVNSTTVTVDDPVITLGGDTAPTSDDNKDRGVEFRWHNGTAAKVGFFGYDDSASVFTFIPDATNTSEVFSGSAGNVAFGNIAGTLTTAAQTNITSVGTLSSLTVSGDLTVDTSTLVVDSTNNRVGILDATPAVTLDIGTATDAIFVPSGTTAQRPGTPSNGYLRYNTDDAQFEGYADGAWGAIAGSGSGSAMEQQILSGDGSTTGFTLTSAPTSENNLLVFVDGVFQAQDTYSVSGTTLTFSTAPANGRVITVYHILSNISGSNMIVDSMTGDGSDVTLTLSVAPVSENNVQVYIDGVYQSKSNYSISGTTLTFTTAPPNGTAVEAITHTQTSINTPANGSVAPASIASGDFYFDTNTLYIDATNNRVGINTSSPAYALDITTTASQGLKLDGTGTGGSWMAFSTSGTIYGYIASAYHVFSGGSVSDFGIRGENNLVFGTSGTERMRIDSSGNVGIGTSTAPAANGGGLAIYRSDYPRITLRNSTSGDTTGDGFQAALVGNDMQWNLAESGSQQFFTGGTERMRIHSAGGFSVANTGTVGTFYNGASTGFGYDSGLYCGIVRSGTNTPLYVSTTGTGAGGFIEFYQATSVRGNITFNGSSTLYNATSDYRLKENVVELPNALQRVGQLNPVQFDWIESGISSEGFLAHEAQAVVPYSVTGQQDELYTEDNAAEEQINLIGQPKYQTMDYGKLTPLLVKAIQEQQTIIDDLKARIETLENA